MIGKLNITNTTVDDVYNLYSFAPTITRQEIEDLINRGVKANMGELQIILPNNLLKNNDYKQRLKLLNLYRNKLQEKESKIAAAEAIKLVETIEKQIKFRQEVSETMSSTMLEHAKTVIRFSHTDIQDQTSYTVACMLKGFSIEYMIKMIGILTKNNYVENKSQTHDLGDLETINKIFREYKDDANAKNTTGINLIINGHEINALLLSLPEPIANLIRYKALVNLSDDTIIYDGNINVKKINAADYLVMTCCSDFPKEVENQNEVLKKIIQYL